MKHAVMKNAVILFSAFAALLSCKTRTYDLGSRQSNAESNSNALIHGFKANTDTKIRSRSPVALGGVVECVLPAGTEYKIVSFQERDIASRRRNSYVFVEFDNPLGNTVVCTGSSDEEWDRGDGWIESTSIAWKKESVVESVLEQGQGPITIAEATLAGFQNYDPVYGQRLAKFAKNPDGKYAVGRCYQAVADAIDAALGAAQNYGRLNVYPYCARTFSDNWDPFVHERQFRLRKIATSDKSILPKLPVGSIIVTGRCGAVNNNCSGGKLGYGDIMVKVDAQGTTASFYTSSIRAGCAAYAPLLAVFIPIKL